LHNSGTSFSRAGGSGLREFEVFPGTLSAVDESGLSHSVVTTGDAAASSVQSRFGGRSLLFNGGYLSIPSHSSFGMGTGNFTIEMFVYPTSSTLVGGLINLGTYDNGLLWRRGSNPDQLYLNGAYSTWNPPTNAPLNTWTHLALVRNGSTVTVYANGVAVHTTSSSADLGSSKSVVIGTGAHQASEVFRGYIDDLRVVKGSAVYTANFTPPASTLTAITGTSLLLRADSDTIIQSGQFDSFDLSNNSITRLRAEGLSLDQSGSGSVYSTSLQSYVVVPGNMEQGNLSDNSLAAASLDQFYNDLSSGGGALYVAGNPGISVDTPAIATAKGYSIFGSTPPPTTSLLLNFNGSNNSTSFTDSSPAGLTITRVGNPVISTTQSRFGGSSGFTNGSSSPASYLTFDRSAFDFGGEDFTIEWWMFYAGSVTTNIVGVFGGGVGGGNSQQGIRCGIGINGTTRRLQVQATVEGGTVKVWQATSNVIANTWIHYAITRKNGAISLWRGGAAQGAAQDAKIIFSSESHPASLFASSGNDGQNATHGRSIYIDDFRIVKGQAMYTAAFTPPTSQLSVV
jgi:hypothetical protein